MEKVGIVTQLEQKLDALKSSAMAEKVKHSKTLDALKLVFSETIRELRAEMLKREEMLDQELAVRRQRDSLKEKEVELSKRQEESRNTVEAAFQRLEHARSKDMTRLVGRARLKNQGLIQAYK